MPLGRRPPPVSGRSPETLHPIARVDARQRLGMAGDTLPFGGEDRWTGYELSWLDLSGKPQVAGLEVRVPCASPNMVESKSFKLYLNGLAQARFRDRSELADALLADLSAATGAEVSVRIFDLADLVPAGKGLPGQSLDWLAPARFEYRCNPELLQSAEPRKPASETWHTDLFRSLCPVTGQPDWASIWVSYTGPLIAAESLLAYLVSFREHPCFHEDAIERIYIDIQQRCQPTRLTVSGHFLRRGGLDINPYRSNEQRTAPSHRLPRQ